jgi:hypothetical protein
MASDDQGKDAKDPRPKVVKLKLRYKSATVDEFIERYALDISPLGIRVDIATPLAAGTLVKLEVRLASEQVVIKGAGRVVWSRDRPQAGDTRRGGVWIEFIQIDEPSTAFIEDVVIARPDAGLAYEEHAEKEAEKEAEEDAEDTVLGSLAQLHQEAPALPAPAARSLKATLVGITAPATPPTRPRLPSLPPPRAPLPANALPLPAPPAPPARAASTLTATPTGIAAPATPPQRARMSSLPPGPIPLPAKARSVPSPPGRASEDRGEMDAEDATVVWGDESLHQALSASPAPAASALKKTTLVGITAPATLPVRTALPSLPPPRAPLPKASPAPPPAPPASEEQWEEEETSIWDHEQSVQEASAPPASSTPGARPAAATAQEGAARAVLAKTIVTRKTAAPALEGSSGRRWGRAGATVALGFLAAVAIALAMRSAYWLRPSTTSAPAPMLGREGATTIAPAMSSPESTPVPALRAVETPADAAPATTTPAGVAGAPPTMGTSPQAISIPIPAPGPKLAPAPRAISPVATGIPAAPAKPKPKPPPAPAPTIDDGF